MTTITEALRAARACIQQDRTILADTGMRHDNTMDPDAAAGVAEYDAVLQQIDVALAGMTHHITDEQIDAVCLSLTGTYTRKERDRAVARAVLALAAPQGEPYGWAVTGCHSLYRGEWAESTAQAEARRCGGTAVAFPLYTAPAPAAPSDAEIEANIWPALRLNGHPNLTLYDCIASIRAALTAAPTPPAQSAVPEDVAREPMTQRWCWWIGDAETFHIADTEDEAHGEARCRIDDDCEPGYTREYSVARVQHPIDSLGMDWLAEHVADTIEESACEWCDDNNGAEDPSITLAAEDRKVLGTMVAAFLREKAAVHWWTADQKTITTHTYVAGSSDDAEAARAAEKGGE